MKRKNVIISIAVFLFALSFVHCSEHVSAPPDIPIDKLSSAADSLTIDDQTIVLSTYLWRDFQPISPPDGKPLSALIYIDNTDTTSLPSAIGADAVYIVNRNYVWKSFFSNEVIPPADRDKYRLIKIARNGPRWGPNIKVDVVVRVTHGERSYLLKAEGQYIWRTD